MKMNILLLGLVVLLGACTAAVQNEVSEVMMEEPMEDKTMEEKAMMEESMEEKAMEEKQMMEESMEEKGAMQETTAGDYSGNVLAGSKTKYLEFNQADYEKALAENKRVFLYFYASWCPSCKAEQKDAHAAFDELDDENLVGFRVNYRDSDTDDYEVELAKKFGISYQHTKVIIENGDRKLKSPETWNKNEYLEELA